MAVDQRSEVDVMMGTGGTPEGVLAALRHQGRGGAMLARLDPQSEAEKAAIQEAGIDLAQILDADTLVQGDDVFFAATGISGGTFLRGVQFSGQGAVTHSMIIRSKTGTMRYIESHHNWNKLHADQFHQIRLIYYTPGQRGSIFLSRRNNGRRPSLQQAT